MVLSHGEIFLQNFNLSIQAELASNQLSESQNLLITDERTSVKIFTGFKLILTYIGNYWLEDVRSVLFTVYNMKMSCSLAIFPAGVVCTRRNICVTLFQVALLNIFGHVFQLIPQVTG